MSKHNTETAERKASTWAARARQLKQIILEGMRDLGAHYDSLPTGLDFTGLMDCRAAAGLPAHATSSHERDRIARRAMAEFDAAFKMFARNLDSKLPQCIQRLEALTTAAAERGDAGAIAGCSISPDAVSTYTGGEAVGLPEVYQVVALHKLPAEHPLRDLLSPERLAGGRLCLGPAGLERTRGPRHAPPWIATPEIVRWAAVYRAYSEAVELQRRETIEARREYDRRESLPVLTPEQRRIQTIEARLEKMERERIGSAGV